MTTAPTPTKHGPVSYTHLDGPSSHHAVELAHQYAWIWAAVGSHPDDAEQVDEARSGEYRALCKDPRVKAIGEIGLDYHYEDPPRDVQQRAFRMQMKLAQELSIPVVIHEREVMMRYGSFVPFVTRSSMSVPI